MDKYIEKLRKKKNEQIETENSQLLVLFYGSLLGKIPIAASKYESVSEDNFVQISITQIQFSHRLQ